MHITRWQDQIIKGSLLGKGYLTGSPYLGISENSDPDWLAFKTLQLRSLAAKTPIYKSGNHLKWRSRTSEVWEPYRRMFYGEKGKAVGMDVLDTLRPIALAVWFGDKGYWYSSKRLGLRSTAFGPSNEVFWKFFNEVGMSCKLYTDHYLATRIVFDPRGTKTLLDTVLPQLPLFTLQKFKLI